MTELLGQITAFLPIYLFSPPMYTGMLFMLSSGQDCRRRALAAFVGSALAVAVIGLIALVLGISVFQMRRPLTLSGVVNIVLGVLLILAGIRLLYRKSRARDDKPASTVLLALTNPRLAMCAAGGFLLTVANPTSLASFVASVKLAIDADVRVSQALAAVGVAGLFYTLPILMPLLLTMFVPETTERFLHQTDRFLKRYGDYIMMALILLLGGFLIYRGFNFLSQR